MQVRYPKFDFAEIKPHWAPCIEFAQTFNAASLVPAYIEPYLVKVMVKAKAALDPKNTALHRDLDIFIKQETQHCRQHLAFNEMMRKSGYEGMVPIEKAYAADYEAFLKHKSLRFNCAYSEGFEAMSAFAVTTMFEECDAFVMDADPAAVDLWKWHLAEEYEHREVAHEVYHALFGQNPVLTYLYRIYGFVYAVCHITKHTSRLAAYLLGKDREGMTPEEVKQSKAREMKVKALMLRHAREHLFEILSPFYQPAKRRAPRGLNDYLTRFTEAAAGAR